MGKKRAQSHLTEYIEGDPVKKLKTPDRSDAENLKWYYDFDSLSPILLSTEYLQNLNDAEKSKLENQPLIDATSRQSIPLLDFNKVKTGIANKTIVINNNKAPSIKSRAELWKEYEKKFQKPAIYSSKSSSTFC